MAPQARAASHRGGHPGGSSTGFYTLVAIVGFSVGLLGGYLLLGNPRSVGRAAVVAGLQTAAGMQTGSRCSGMSLSLHLDGCGGSPTRVLISLCFVTVGPCACVLQESSVKSNTLEDLHALHGASLGLSLEVLNPAGGLCRHRAGAAGLVLCATLVGGTSLRW